MINQFLKKHCIHLLPKSKFIQNFIVVLSGTMCSQLLFLIATPLLTHLYSPKNFGFFSVFNSLLTIFTAITSMRYEVAIPVADDEREVINLTCLCLILVLLITIVTTGLIFFVGDDVFKLLKIENHTNFWFFPVGILCAGIFQVFSFLAIRKKMFPAIALTRINQTIISLAVRLTGYSLGSVTLVCSQLISLGVGSSLLAKHTIIDFNFKTITTKNMLAVLKKYKKFPLFSTWSGLFNAISTSLAPVLFTIFFSPATAGLFSVAKRILITPIELISGSVSNVFFSDSVENKAQGSLAKKAYSLHEHLALLGIPVFLLVIIIGPELFKWALGQQWYTSGEIARWLSLWLYLSFSSAHFGAIPIILEKQKFSFIYDFLMLIIRASVIIVGAYFQSLKLTIIALSLTEALMLFLYIAGIFMFLKLSIMKLIMIHIKSLLVGIATTLPVIIAKVLDKYVFFSLCITAVILTCYYFKRLKRFYK